MIPKTMPKTVPKAPPQMLPEQHPRQPAARPPWGGSIIKSSEVLLSNLEYASRIQSRSNPGVASGVRVCFCVCAHLLQPQNQSFRLGISSSAPVAHINARVCVCLCARSLSCFLWESFAPIAYINTDAASHRSTNLVALLGVIPPTCCQILTLRSLQRFRALLCLPDLVRGQL